MSFRVAAIQTRPVFGDVEGNVPRAIALAERVRPQAALYVFPELMTSGYVFVARSEAMALAETPGARGAAHAPGLVALGRWAKEKGAWACAGFPEKDGTKLYNSAALIAPSGRVQDVYRKIHLFDEEKRWFEPGDRAPRITRVGQARVGMMICYDWRFPELARLLALDGADLIAHPSNLVFTLAQQAMRTRALENRVYTVTANRVGEDVRPKKRLGFTGRSQIVGVNGELIVQAPERTPKAIAATLDLACARDKTFTPRNNLIEDRRPEFYKDLARPVRRSRA